MRKYGFLAFLIVALFLAAGLLRLIGLHSGATGMPAKAKVIQQPKR